MKFELSASPSIGKKGNKKGFKWKTPLLGGLMLLSVSPLYTKNTSCQRSNNGAQNRPSALKEKTIFMYKVGDWIKSNNGEKFKIKKRWVGALGVRCYAGGKNVHFESEVTKTNGSIEEERKMWWKKLKRYVYSLIGITVLAPLLAWLDSGGNSSRKSCSNGGRHDAQESWRELHGRKDDERYMKKIEGRGPSEY